MDYAKQIFEMLGVKPGRIFKLKEMPNYSYKLTNNLKLYIRSDTDKKWFIDHGNRTLFMILKGVFNIRSDDQNKKSVCQFYSEGKCRAVLYRPCVDCKGNRISCVWS